MEVKKPVKVKFSGRNTKMGAYTRYRIFSLRQKKEIRPHRTESSRTGNHWTDIWWLLPGKYFICYTDITNSGKHHCGYACLIVEGDGYRTEPWKGVIPDYAEEYLCDCLIECRMPEY
jgi:hypothetical protein